MSTYAVDTFAAWPCGDAGSRTRVRSAERVAYSMRSQSTEFRKRARRQTGTLLAIVRLFNRYAERHTQQRYTEKRHRFAQAVSLMRSMESGTEARRFQLRLLFRQP